MALDVRVSVPEGEDAEHFSHVMAEHLERFRRRDELHVEWESRRTEGRDAALAAVLNPLAARPWRRCGGTAQDSSKFGSAQ